MFIIRIEITDKYDFFVIGLGIDGMDPALKVARFTFNSYVLFGFE